MIYLTVIPSYSKRKVTETIQSSVELMDDLVVMVSVFRADLRKSDDESMPATNEYLSIKSIYKRQFISGVELQYYHDEKVWGVCIYVVGSGGCEPCFKEEKQVIAFIDDILAWSSKPSLYPHVN